jgi:alanyl-tRNA synthetase
MKKIAGFEIRQSFIDFFVEHGHTAVPSSSLVPGGDSTLLFTNAGMVQFKDVFLGTDRRPYTRAVDSQKCMRVAGKHNDLDDVGRDDTHHTFFEMLGNWSFGDYYKKEAITWAWQLLTEVWGLDKSCVWATCFEGEANIPPDEEAADYWRAQSGFTREHVLFFNRKDNFWEMAETGPCGPCSEVHYDRGEKYCDKQGVPGHVCKVNGDCKRFLELWNLVFIQYNRLAPDKLEPLPARHVDTGMGFERIVSVLQDVDSNYKTDLFAKSLSTLRSLTGHSEKEMLANFTPYRVVADHTRSAAFLIADGVVPGNVGRNYVCRMIIRRAARFGAKIGLTGPFLAKIAETVIETYGGFYPELAHSRTAILDNLTREEIRFARTIESGTGYLENQLSQLHSSSQTILEGHKAFELYATYGLPFEIARDIAREHNLEVDEIGFRSAMAEHRLASGGGKAMGKMGGEDAEFFATVFKDIQKKGGLKNGVEYDPYDPTPLTGSLLALISDNQVVDTASAGDAVEAVIPKTNFYIESGGQVADTGYLRAMDGGWEIEINGVRRPSTGILVHSGEIVFGHPKAGDACIAEVDWPRRQDIMRNHTATHLLHAALHQVLGQHARQAGSLVAPDRLRFDFNHPEAMTSEQIERVEKIVNDAIAADYKVTQVTKSREGAIKEGAMALFGEKYGETVRTITIGDLKAKYSYELCGGTHLERTSNAGVFLILGESSAAAGVRRIEAVTGRAAYELVAQRFRILKQTATILKSGADEVLQKVRNLQDELSGVTREITALRTQRALSIFMTQIVSVQLVKDVSVLAVEVADSDAELLRALADKFRETYPIRSVCVLASKVDGKSTLLCAVTEDLVGRGLKAAEIITSMGGRGGGRPTLAQGSLPEAVQIGEALAKTMAVVNEKLRS